LSNYTYAKVENDVDLKYFTIEDDKSDLIPMILTPNPFLKMGLKSYHHPGPAHLG
jgi:glucosylceramidase